MIVVVLHKIWVHIVHGTHFSENLVIMNIYFISLLSNFPARPVKLRSFYHRRLILELFHSVVTLQNVQNIFSFLTEGNLTAESSGLSTKVKFQIALVHYTLQKTMRSERSKRTTWVNSAKDSEQDSEQGPGAISKVSISELCHRSKVSVIIFSSGSLKKIEERSLVRKPDKMFCKRKRIQDL